MKKIINKFAFLAMMALVPALTSCQGLIDAIVGNEDSPSSTPTVVHISGISISGDDIVDGVITINKGLKSQLTANITPSDTEETSVNWKSSDESVVKVSSTGQITAVKAGTATVTVTSAIDTTISASVLVIVEDGELNMSDDPVDQSTADSRD